MFFTKVCHLSITFVGQGPETPETPEAPDSIMVMVEMIVSYKCSSLLWYVINCDRKKMMIVDTQDVDLIKPF
jgi:hypothetical protein